MKLRVVIAGLIGLGMAVGLLGPLGVRFNLTGSLPLGIYLVSSEAPSRGSIVNVCLDGSAADFARKRGYLGPGSCVSGVRPLGKIVVAVEGDLVAIDRDAVRINGAVIPNSRTIALDTRGRVLPHYPWGVHRLDRHELWLFSPYHRNAYDSRYIGPVHRNQIVSVLKPVWTQRTAVPAAPADSAISPSPRRAISRQAAVRLRVSRTP